MHTQTRKLRSNVENSAYLSSSQRPRIAIRTLTLNASGSPALPLDDALDAERDAVEAIRTTPAVTVSDKLKKIDVLPDLTQVEWLDGCDVRLLESIRRDVQAMGRSAA
jgi:hypothetical protein